MCVRHAGMCSSASHHCGSAFRRPRLRCVGEEEQVTAGCRSKARLLAACPSLHVRDQQPEAPQASHCGVAGSLEDLFKVLGPCSAARAQVCCSYIELYNEELRDLLRPHGAACGKVSTTRRQAVLKRPLTWACH